ncbi:MAG TPA: tetratricopeptide repeat protein [Longimicrobium sp.]|nr:tetratricopeptide repeat protein [Longimicrobium sp.]
MSATPQQLRQWSEEVAADPGSPAFLPLARYYRDAGRTEAALRLVLRGLERHPNDVEAHHLLGLLYLDAGDAVKAFDEWDIALALAPEHHGARRQIAFLCHARGEVEAAERHLEKALEGDFEDREVRRLLEEIYAAKRTTRPGRRRPADGTGASAAPSAQAAPAPPAAAPTAPAVPPATATAPVAAPPPPPAVSADPGSGDGSAFDVLERELRAVGAERGMIGAVLLDAQGYVVAGEMQAGGRDRGPEIAAVLSPASTEAERAVRHLKLGGWKGILVETPDAVIRLTPTADGGMMAVAGRRDVPMGWVLRVASRARDAAGRFVAATGGGAA